MNALRERVAAFLQRLFDRLDKLLGRKPQPTGDERILCDTCKYDYGGACTRPERPNATSCPDYKSARR
ncbi:MAG: hypothetical protein NTW87_08535 [Planctomycetota bacterium]|nr:hypothetical protein [Planctomycetota bacterium]